MTTNLAQEITQPNYFRPARNVGSAVIPVHRFCSMEAGENGVDLAGSPGDTLAGVSVEPIAVGMTRSVQVDGRAILETGGSFARGAALTTDATGRAVAAVGTQTVFGEATQPSTGAGEFVGVEIGKRATSAGNVLVQEVTITHADLTAAAATESVNLGAALPTNARVLGVESHLTTAFTGGTVSAIVCEAGHAGDTDSLITARNIFTGAAQTLPGNGVRPLGTYSGTQLTALFTATGGQVVALTAGSITFRIFYAVAAAA